ncbi:MAG TPA: ProQ/FinO family protein [Ideonella sp.]|nr:ProQ/FinO family protein [Ideonella sp.]
MSSIPQQPSPDGDAPSNAPGETLIDTPAPAPDLATGDTLGDAADDSAGHAADDTADNTADDAAVQDAAPAGDPAAGDLPAAAAVPAADSSPAATAQQLKQRFPALFSGQPKPLKLRIQVDIQERAPGVFSKQALTAFFRRYTGSHAYLLAASRATHRFDLDGAPAGELSEEHRKIALDELARRRSNTEARRALEDEQRRNRATLLHDFERTTLTPANFCALKGITTDELEEFLGIARQEAAERAAQAPAFERERGGPPRDHSRERPRGEHPREPQDRGRRGGPPPGPRQGQGPRPNAGPGNGPGRRRR